MELDHYEYKIVVEEDEDTWYYIIYQNCICSCCGNEHRNEVGSAYDFASEDSAIEAAIDDINKLRQ